MGILSVPIASLSVKRAGKNSVRYALWTNVQFVETLYVMNARLRAQCAISAYARHTVSDAALARMKYALDARQCVQNATSHSVKTILTQQGKFAWNAQRL